MRLRPRVEIIVIDPVTRSVFCGKWSDGSLALPGGGIDSNESINEAAVREAAEECGFKVGRVTQLAVASEVEKWSDSYKKRLPADRQEFDGSETRWCIAEFSRKMPNANLDTWNCSDKRFRSFEDAMALPAPSDERFGDMNQKRKLALAEAKSMVTGLSVKTGFERFPLGGYAASDGYVRPWSIDITRNRATAPNPYKPSKLPQPKVAGMSNTKTKKSKNDDLVSGGDAVFKSLEQYMRKNGADGLQAGFLSRLLLSGASGYQIKSAIERVGAIDKQASDHLMRGFNLVWTKELFEKVALSSNLGKRLGDVFSSAPKPKQLLPIESQTSDYTQNFNTSPLAKKPAAQPAAQPATPTATQPAARAADQPSAQPAAQTTTPAATQPAAAAGSQQGRGFMSRYGVPAAVGAGGAGVAGTAAYALGPNKDSIVKDLGIPLTQDGKVDYSAIMGTAMKDPKLKSEMQGQMTGQFFEQVKPWLPYLLGGLIGAGGGGLLGGTSGAVLGGISVPLLLWLAQSNGLLDGFGGGTPPADGATPPATTDTGSGAGAGTAAAAAAATGGALSNAANAAGGAQGAFNAATNAAGQANSNAARGAQGAFNAATNAAGQANSNAARGAQGAFDTAINAAGQANAGTAGSAIDAASNAAAASGRGASGRAGGLFNALRESMNAASDPTSFGPFNGANSVLNAARDGSEMVNSAAGAAGGASR